MLPKKILLREVGLREGLQSISRPVSIEDKLTLLNLLSDTKVKSIELGSYVRTDKVPSMADVPELVRRFTARTGTSYTALYLNLKGFELAELSGRLNNQGWITLATSETFLQKNANTSLKEILDQIPTWAAAFKKYNKTAYGMMISTAFGCAYEGLLPVERLVDVASKALVAGQRAQLDFREICLADTVGLANPQSIKRALSELRAKFPQINFSLHLHDTRGLGIANALAGLEMGVDTFEASIGGLGGCPFSPGASGNIASEDFLYLCQTLGVETGVDLIAYRNAVLGFEKILQITLPGKWSKAANIN